MSIEVVKSASFKQWFRQTSAKNNNIAFLAMDLGGEELDNPFFSRQLYIKFTDKCADILVAVVHAFLILQIKENICLVCKTNRQSESHEIGD